MFRPIPRASLRSPLPSAAGVLRAAPRRTMFTAPAQKKPSLKSKLARWGAAGGIVWYFSSSNILADEGRFASDRPPVNMAETDPRPVSQLDSYVQKTPAVPAAPTTSAVAATPAAEHIPTAEGSVEELEEEAGQEGAFNPETGEINWDCPCLGGMAHGPCGPEFKQAFSCFIFSKEDPKGSDCVDHFRTMQKCFMEHPEIYGDEMAPDDDDEDAVDVAAAQGERDPPAPVLDVQQADEDDMDKIATKAATQEQESEQKTETLAPLDPNNLAATRSPATSAVEPRPSDVKPRTAKPDTEPLGAKTKEEKVRGATAGVEENQTRRS